MFEIKNYQQKMSQAIEHFEEELRKIRTGRAHPQMLDGVEAEVYGAKMPLNQLANISTVDAQMLSVTPFDPANITAIAAAIRDNRTLGFNPSDDGKIIRIAIPALTEERRHQLAKQANEKLEDVRIVIRNIRQEALKELKKLKDNKEMGEDDQKNFEKKVTELVSEMQSQAEKITKNKEEDILKI